MPSDDLIKDFIERTDKRFDRVDEKLDELIAFRWQIIGGSIGLSALFSVLVNGLFLFLGGK